jgi:hypothetical protein
VTAIKKDIKVEQGAKFVLNIAVQNADKTPKDLTGYSGKMQVRPAPGGTLLMEASTANGFLTINAPGGIVMINVPSTTTDPMVWTNGVWDLEISTSTADVIRLAEGFASLSQEVTV